MEALQMKRFLWLLLDLLAFCVATAVGQAATGSVWIGWACGALVVVYGMACIYQGADL